MTTKRRKHFAGVFIYMDKFLKNAPRGLDGLWTASDLCEKFIDYHHDYALPMDEGDKKEALEYLQRQFLGINLEKYQEDWLDEVRMARDDAARSDYERQFYEWYKDGLETAANSTGLDWYWVKGHAHQKEPEPCEFYEATGIYFYVSRKKFLDRTQGWWPVWEAGYPTPILFDKWDDYATNAERCEDAEDVLTEHIKEAEKVDFKFFDYYGSRYCDPSDWKEFLRGEVEWQIRKDLKEHHSQVKGWIKNKVPHIHRLEFNQEPRCAC